MQFLWPNSELVGSSQCRTDTHKKETNMVANFTFPKKQLLKRHMNLETKIKISHRNAYSEKVNSIR